MRIPALTSSSIAPGCGGYEAHMQQILTPYGVLADIGDHDFCIRNRQNQAKPSGKRKPSQFSRVFLEAPDGLRRDKEIQQASIEASSSQKPRNHRFRGFFSEFLIGNRIARSCKGLLLGFTVSYRYLCRERGTVNPFFSDVHLLTFYVNAYIIFHK